MSEYLDKYLATDLTIHLPTGSFLLTDKERTDALPQPPHEFVNSTWVVITAWNPASDASTSFEQNAKAQAELRTILEARYHSVFAARGDDADAATGYGEDMLAVAVDPDEFDEDLIAEFTDIAEEYGQNVFFSVSGNVVCLHPGIDSNYIGERVKRVIKVS
jgi:hypothetical protein